MGDRPDPAVSALRIVSACTTAEQFVVAFARYCEQTSLFIATQNPKRLGEKVRFTLTLAGGNPVITGQGHVIESYPDRANRFERAGMRIRFDELDDMSRDWVRVLTSQASRHGKPTVPAPMAATATKPGAAPPPIPVEARSPSVAEGDPRTPGSATVLPANPFGQVDEASLEAYVECSLFELTPEQLEAMAWDEDTDVVSPAAFLDALKHHSTEVAAEQGAHATAASATAEAAKPASKPLPKPGARTLFGMGGATGAPLATGTGAGAASAGAGSAAAGADSAASASDAASARAGIGKTQALGEGTFGLDKLGPRADSRAESIAEEDLEPLSEDEASASDDGAATLRGGHVQTGAAVMYEPTEPVERVDYAQPLWKRKVSVAAMLGATLGALVVGLLIGRGTASPGAESAPAARRDTPESREAAKPASEVSAAGSAESPPTASKVAAASAPDESDESDEPDESERPAAREAAAVSPPVPIVSGECALTATSRPEGAVVTLGGRRLGETPLAQTTVPCGRAVIHFERPRYEPDEKSIALSPGEPQDVSVRLARPIIQIKIDSNPRGATVKLRGRTAGKTPLSTSIEAFETSSIVITKPGYRTEKRSVRPKREPERVSVKLVKEDAGASTPRR